MSFDYQAFTTRNLGFVTPAEQARLREGAVFVAGVGGMGGACVATLVRAGLGRVAIADIDRFEVSNLNRQVFANLDTLGEEKAVASAAALKRINPELELEVYDARWTAELPAIAGRYPVIVNGCDDVAATVTSTGWRGKRALAWWTPMLRPCRPSPWSGRPPLALKSDCAIPPAARPGTGSRRKRPARPS